MSEAKKKGWVFQSLVAGAAFIAPLVTVCILYRWFSDWADSWLGLLSQAILNNFLPDNVSIPALQQFLSLAIALVFLFFIGRIALWKPGRRGLSLVDLLFERLPGIGTIYSWVKKTLESLQASDQQRWTRVVLVKFGGPMVLGFVTGETIIDGKKHLVCWTPHAPNPTSGLPLFVPEEEAIDSGITPDEAMKLAISLGMTAPPVIPLRGK